MNLLRCLAAAALIGVLIPVVSAQNLSTPDEHRRPPDQTYLTFPEWFLVHSPAEYAEFLHDTPPHLFPYWGHINQFWDSYGAVSGEVKGRYPPNYGYHVMVSVIGTSTTVEYGLKSTYEKLVGRLTALGTDYAATAEDKLAAEVAQDYVDFIRVDPWYKYDFGQRLKEVWTDTGLWGPHPLRKWERKYALTTEYLAKAIYAWMIGKATAAGYEAPLPVTAVVVSNGSAQTYAAESREILAGADGAGQEALILLPRYQAFTTAATNLARSGVEFHEIAGNREDILISVIARDNSRLDETRHSVLLRQPILTQDGSRRYLLRVPIATLAEDLRDLASSNIEIEHIYDF